MTRTVLRWSDGTIDFDAVEIEAYDLDAQITKYPVELGASLADHIIVEPTAVRLTVIISNDPSREGLSHLDGAAPSRGVDIAVRKTVPGPVDSVAGIQLARDSVVRADVRVWGANGGKVQRVQNVFAELVRARRDGRVFTIATEIGDFDGMLLKSIRKQRTATNARAPKYDLEFQEFLASVLERREITQDAQPRKARSKKPLDAGKKQATVAPTSAANKSSALYRATHGDVSSASSGNFVELIP